MSEFIEVLPLGEVVKPNRPRVKPELMPDVPFIGMEHVEAHTMKLLGTVPAGSMKSAAVHFKPGDVLYGRLRPYLNKVYRPQFEGLCSAEFIVLPENERIEGSYLQYFLNSGAFVRFASHLNAGDRPRVDFDQLSSFEIPLPSVSRQREIVAEIEKQFSRLDEAVANLQRVKANLRRYKAAVLKAAVEGHLVETEAELARREGRTYETGEQLLHRTTEGRSSGSKVRRRKIRMAGMPTANAREIPDGWIWTTTGEVCECIVPNRDKPKTFSGDIPWLTLPDFDDSVITVARSRSGLGFTDSEVALYRAKAIPTDSVVMSCVGRFGVSAVLARRAVINQQLHAFLPSEGVVPKYLAYVLRTREQEMLEKSTATTIAYLNKENCNSISVPLPPRAEQARIVAEVDRYLSIIREVEAEVDANLQRAEALRQATLANAFMVRSAE